MKKIIAFVFTAILFLNNTCVFAQKKLTEGKVVFEITYPDVEMDQQTMAMLPDKSTVYFKNEKSRVEVYMAMGSTIVISDGKEQTTTTLMDMMGNKFAIHMTKDEIEKDKKNKENNTVKITDKTKEIAGYTCKMAIVTPEDTTEVAPYEVWFTDQVGASNSFRSNIKGIDGFLMEFKTRQNNMTMNMTCKSVKDEKVEDDMFVIPEGYKMMTMDELRGMMGGK